MESKERLIRRDIGVIAVILAFCMLWVGGCAKTQAQIDVDALAARLAEEVTYGEELNKLDSGAVERLYRIDASLVKAVCAYVGSGATVDEVSVWEGVDDDAATQIEETLKERIATQEKNYADYKPEEIPKLDDAVLQKSGPYVVMCITQDSDTVDEIIQETFEPK